MADILTHPVPAVIILLGLLVFVHEFGHFIVGRMCGIAVETFSIGFGPPIVKFVRGGTDYRIAWIPLGGYVKFAGAHPSEDVPEGLDGIPYRDASLIKRAAAVSAGPIANFLLAIVVYAILGAAGVEHPPPSIGGVMPGSPAEAAGIKYGDLITEIDGKDIPYWENLEEVVSKSAGKTIPIKLLRNDTQVSLELKPDKVEVTNFLGKKVEIGRIGVARVRLPSIVSVIDQATPAFAAGLKTGDRIESIKVNGKWREVAFFPDVESALRAAAEGGQSSIEMKVHQAAIPKLPATDPTDVVVDSENGPTRTITVDSSVLLAAAEVNDAARALGIVDAQLTVADVKYSFQGKLESGDRLVAFNKTTLRSVFHLRELLNDNKSQAASLQVVRDYETVNLNVDLHPVDAQRPEGKVTLYTFPAMFLGQLEEPEFLIEKYSNPFSAILYGIKHTAIRSAGLVVTVAQLFTGEIPLGALGGPMLIAKVAGDSAKAGWQTFLGSLALISINLGIINLFPIPVLDGGQLVLMGAEAVRRRPLRERSIENFQKLGFAMVMALVVLATYNDLSRFWKSMLESLVGVFQ
jgi:regulator of sigma E protease